MIWRGGRRVAVVDKQSLDRRIRRTFHDSPFSGCRVRAEGIPQPSHVHQARPRVFEILARQIPEMEQSAGAQQNPAPLQLPRAGQRREQGDVPDRHPSSAVPLQTVVHSDGRRLGGGVFHGKRFDGLRCDPGDVRYPFQRPFVESVQEFVEPQRVPGDVLPIVQPSIHDNFHHPKSEGSVRTGPDRYPPICLGGGARAHRIDDHYSGAFVPCFLDERPEVHVGGDRVASPDDDEPGMLEIFGEHPHVGSDAVFVSFSSGGGTK